MENNLQNYLDTLAQYYDLSYTQTRDVDFFLKMAKRFGGPVLELGCGTGRLLLPIAQAGCRVTGLDISSAMLSIAQEKLTALSPQVAKKVTLVQGDFRDFKLEGKFKFIFIAFNTFYHNLTLEDQQNTLRRALKHLDETGRLCMAVFNPKLEFITSAKQGAMTHDFTVQDADRGLTLSRFSISTFHPFDQLLDVDFIYDVFEAGYKFERQLVRFRLRYLFKNELVLLLENCGLKIEEKYGDYDQTPLEEGCPQLIMLARKA
jgi:SAM-dependent methyltransferase